MKTVNIEKELGAAAEARKNEALGFKLVLETQKLLGYDDTEDRRILRKLSPSCNEVYAEHKHGELLILENLERQYGKKPISLNSIKRLAQKYRLRFLPTTAFKNSYTPEVISKIKSFAKEHNIALDEHNLTSKFFILAPAATFNLKEGVKRSDFVQESEAAKQRRIARQLDPSIFYKVSDNEFIHLATWGKDFTIARAILGFFTKNHTNFFLSNAVIATLVTIIGLLLFTNGSLITLAGIAVGIGLLFASILLVCYDGFLSNQVWNSEKINEDRRIVIQ